MDKVAVLRKGDLDLGSIISELSKDKNLLKCGAIVTFIGQVRETAREKGKVIKLIYECAEEAAVKELGKIREEILDKYDIEELYIYHFVGELVPGEHTIYIVAAAPHRKAAFQAASEALELVKERVPIWKKEVTDKGEYWVSGDEVLEM